MHRVERQVRQKGGSLMLVDKRNSLVGQAASQVLTGWAIGQAGVGVGYEIAFSFR